MPGQKLTSQNKIKSDNGVVQHLTMPYLLKSRSLGFLNIFYLVVMLWIRIEEAWV
jgi:hypothetical protein